MEAPPTVNATPLNTVEVDLDIQHLCEIAEIDDPANGATWTNPLFSGRGVGMYLEDRHYEIHIKNLRKTEDWKYVNKRGKQTLVLTEKGLYTYIIRRNTAFAEKFRDQVFDILHRIRTGEIVKMRKYIQSERARLDSEVDDAWFYKSAFDFVMAGYYRMYTYTSNHKHVDSWKDYLRHCINRVIWKHKFEVLRNPDPNVRRLRRIVTYGHIDKEMKREITRKHKRDFHKSKSNVPGTEFGIYTIFLEHGLFEVNSPPDRDGSDSEGSENYIDKDTLSTADTPKRSICGDSDDE